MEVTDRLDREIKGENASIWYYSDDSIAKVIVKAPSDTIKSIIKGGKVELLFGKDFTGKNRYFHVGVKLYDDPLKPLVISGSLRFADEHNALSQVFTREETHIDFYNELGFCSASALIDFEKEDKQTVINFQDRIELLYSGDFDKSVSASLDCFDFSLDKTRQFENVSEIETVVICGKLKSWVTTNTHFVGLKEASIISIIDKNEGDILEKQVFAALESIFLFDLHRNPKIKKANREEREFIDVLAYHDLGIFLIESKTLGIIASDDDKSMEKKVSTLQKHIRKGIKQLVGAKKNMDRGVEIFDSNNQIINFKRNIIPHCIVLVSDLLPFGEWEAIQIEMYNAMINEGIYLHVLSFLDFIELLKGSKGKKEYFDYFLMERSKTMVNSNSIFIKQVFQEEKRSKDK